MSDGRNGRSRLGAALLLGAALAAACSEALLDPAGSDSLATLGVALAPAPAVAGTNTDAFTRADAAHIRVAASASSSAVLDTIMASSGAGDRSFALPVRLPAATGTYLLSVTLISRGSALFQGSTQIQLRRGYHENAQLTLAPIVAGISVPDTLPTFTALGDSVRVLAAAVFASGDTVTGVLPSWSDDGGGIVRASADGLLTSVREGDARLSATYQGFTATSRVRVQAVVRRIDMTPDSAIVFPDSSRTVLAAARDRNGNQLARAYAWRSADSTIATVDSAGHVRGVAPGRTFVSASVGGQTGRALVIVRPTPVASVAMRPDSAVLIVGDTLRVKATPLDAAGKPLTGRLVAWSSTQAAIATVDTAGLVTALAAGRDTILATIEGKVGITVVKVYPPTLGVGATQVAFTAVLGQGNPSPQQVSVNGNGGLPIAGLATTISYAAGQPSGWLSAALSGASAPATLTLTPSVTGLAVGSYGATVTVTTSTSSRITGVVNVTLTITSSPPPPQPVASVRISPRSVTVPVRGQQQLSASALSATGTPLSSTIAWTTLDSTVVSVTQAGLVTGIAVGSGRVVASAGGHADTVTVTVTANTPVATLQITPHGATIPVGTQQALAATPRDSSGNTLPYTVSWTSLDPSLVSVTQAGSVTGLATGSGRVVASVGGHADTATITVTNTPVSLRISTRADTVGVGGQKQLGAAVLDAGGATLPYAVTWSSLDTTVVSVTSAGVVTGLSAGTGRVVAAAMGLADTATVTVTGAVTVAAVQISPRTATIAVGGQKLLGATALDAAGNALSVAMTWTSLDPGIVSVSQTGLVSGVTTGTGRVSAAAGGKADTATVTVTTSTPVASLRISPHSAVVPVGGQQQFTATVLDASGNALPYTPTWISLDTTLLTVNQSGLATARQTGTARLLATVQGVADTAVVTIDGHLGRTSTSPFSLRQLSLSSGSAAVAYLCGPTAGQGTACVGRSAQAEVAGAWASGSLVSAPVTGTDPGGP